MAKGYRISMAKERRALVRRAEQAWSQVNEEDLPQAFDYSLAADIWSWPRDTVRQSGEVAGKIRNAVDSGDLADSYERSRQGRRRFIHRWGVSYALIVHNGATLTQGDVTAVLPARPWTDEGVAAMPTLFARRFRALG